MPKGFPTKHAHISQTKLDAMADRLERVAAKTLKRDLHFYRADTEDDEEMRVWARKCYNERMLVAKYIRQNRLVRAMNLIDNMGTITRDELPKSVFNWLMRVTD